MLTITQLSPAQQQRFLDCSAEKNIPVDILLEDFCFDPYMKGAITGTLPLVRPLRPDRIRRTLTYLNS